MATQAVAQKVIRIDVVTSAQAQANIKALSTQMAGVETQAKKTQEAVDKGFGGITNAFGSLSRLAAGFGLGFGIGEVAKFVISAADAYSVLESRLRLTLGSQTITNKAMTDVISIAGRTGREIDGVAKLYEKATRAGQQFGIRQSDVAKITEGFSNSLRLSGASTQEAQASLIQFGQALASGRLQGDEFRSLMENNAFFMNEFAKAAGKTTAELRKLGTEGKLDPTFLIDTMLKKGEDGLTLLERINAAAAKVPLTFAQSFSGLVTEINGVIGELGQVFVGSGSKDSKGFFGGAIDSLEELRKQLRLTKEEAMAMDSGFFRRVGAAISTMYQDMNNKFKNAGLDLFGLGKNAEEQVAERAKNVAEKIGIYEKALARAIKNRDEFSEKLGAADFVTSDQLARLQALTDLVAVFTKNVNDLQNLERGRAYGDAAFQTYMDYGGRGAAPSRSSSSDNEDKEAIRKAKAAGEATKAYLFDLKQRVELEEQLARGTSLTNEQIRARQKLDELTSKAGGGGAKSKRLGIELLERAESFEFQRKFNEGMAKINQENTNSTMEGIEAARKSIEADNAQIAAIQNKTKKTQEATTVQLESNLANAEAALWSAKNAGATEAEIKLLEQQVNMLTQAIEKRKELIGVQDKDKVDKANEELRKKEEASFKRRVDSITKSLVKGVGDGKSFADNIEETLKNKVFEIILKPSIDPFSEALTKLSDQLGKMLEDVLGQIANAMSGSGSGGGSGGGIGGLIEKGWTWISSFFADGGIMTPKGSIPLRKYARGGIANTPQVAIYGEGSTNEAYVPLPDGRRIPVAMDGQPQPQTSFNYNIAAGVTRAELLRAMETVRAQTLNDVYKSGRRNGPIGGQQ